ncbi:hypothetical protein BC749_102816 [Flavobacterium araucananum]|uniref:Uncharacterized protein n=1 Tax=Flavobacterium araucananum TaxID=946678 RepID=A0A227P2L5_9FLAO|nr:hypothetical protein [Flavobacterium araucananum]OXG04139.1 hypothetical protein B0A64_15870 [Flavobacterium araucananum]PWK01242.1 hypothetical protein BC749_102816 [Flavobacterium araucananum]
MDKINVQRLKKTLAYLESKQRELKRQNENDTRSIESMIKFLKKDMLEQFKLTNYDIYLKDEINNTETFIQSVKSIIENSLLTDNSH